MPPTKLFFPVQWEADLWQSSLEAACFGSKDSFICLVWPCVHGCIRLLHGGVPDKLEASGAFGVWSPHSHTVCEHSLLLKMAPHTLIGCFKAQSSDEELPQLFGLFGRLWLRRVEKVMAPYSSTLAWKIPWMEEPGRLQSMGSLTVGYDWAISLSLFTLGSINTPIQIIQ